MIQRLKEHFTRDMVRPLVYKALARFLYALTAALLWREFLAGPGQSLHLAFLFLFFLFLAAAWVAWLRLDGLRLPRLPARRLRRRPPDISFGDMEDYLNESPRNFEDLTREEQDACLCLADLLVSFVYLLLSFF